MRVQFARDEQVHDGEQHQQLQSYADDE